MTTDPTPLQERIAGKLCDPGRHVAHWPLVGIDAYCGQCYTLAAAVLPLIAAEVRKAQAEAWGEACEAFAWCIANGPIEDALPYVAEHNPYRETGDQR